MFTVSLLIEIVRTRPRLVFWLVAIGQTLLWLVVPAVFYSAPPGDVTQAIAVGREFALDTSYGPPLAYWLADLALRAAGGHIVGVYLLSQICILVTYWAVFQLGRITLGERHAMLAILLMTGIAVFTVSSPNFGPAILMMPLYALAVLFLWRASGEGREIYWIALALDIGLMLLTSHVALIIVVTLLSFLAATPRGRTSLYSPGAAAAGFIVLFMLLASLAALAHNGVGADLASLRKFGGLGSDLTPAVRLLMYLVIVHAGAIILILVASNLPRDNKADAAVVARAPADRYARDMIYCFAIVPLVTALALAILTGRTEISNLAPLLVFSGLGIVVAGGDNIFLYHQRILGVAWFALLILPPALAAASVVLLPTLFAIDMKTAQPANAVGRFFTENFERRTGSRLEFVSGDARLASLIAAASPHRPRVIFEADKGLPQLLKPQDAAQSGAIVVWRATDNAGTPPPEVKAMFPNIVPEVPRAFERSVHGRAPLLRIGWGLVRPQAKPQ